MKTGDMTLRLYAVLRTDIRMSPGKAMAQAGHAYVAAALAALGSLDGDAYADLNPGTKICLAGGSEDDIIRLRDSLADVKIASIPIIDRDHVELPDFTGAPILTALGLGPIRSMQAPAALRALSLYGFSGKGLNAPFLVNPERDRKWA